MNNEPQKNNTSGVKEYFAPENGVIQRIQKICPISVEGTVNDIIQQMVNNSQLAQCSKLSLVGAVITASRIGVSLDPNLKQAYLIPYKGKCDLQLSYIALSDIVERETGIKIVARLVYQNDTFDVEYGSTPKITHKPKVFGDKGDLIGTVAIAYKNGKLYDFEIMDMDDLQKCRKASKSSNSPAWSTWTNEMYKKSNIRRLCKRLPKATMAAQTLSYDEKKETGADVSEFYDIEGVELPKEEQKETVKPDEQA